MKEQLISLKTAKLAKEKGFNYKTFTLYTTKGLLIHLEAYNWKGYCLDSDLLVGDLQPYCNNDIKTPEEQYGFDNHIIFCTAPTQSLLQKWLRDIHYLHIDIRTNIVSKEAYFITIMEIREPFHTKVSSNEYFNTYEKALEAGLQEALKLVKNEK